MLQEVFQCVSYRVSLVEVDGLAPCARWNIIYVKQPATAARTIQHGFMVYGKTYTRRQFLLFGTV